MSTCAAAPQLYGKYVHVGAKSGVFLTALHLQNNQLQAITTQVYVEDLTRQLASSTAEQPLNQQMHGSAVLHCEWFAEAEPFLTHDK